jgi:flagellar L-ring protein precursor FlgH
MVVAVRPLERGEIVDATDVSLQKRDLATAPGKISRNLADVIGKKVRIGIRGNAPVRSDYLEKQPLVKSGQNVIIIAENEMLKITAVGRVKNTGAEGDLVMVQNLSSMKDVQAESIEVPATDYSNGSIWQAASGSLTEDLKARRKGDMVTVVISEQASASKEATTSTKKDVSASAAIPNFMGLEQTFIKTWMDLNNLINASTGTKFDGAGSTTRKENLTATITASVVDVLPNGNLRIAGRRNVKVNNEDQIILLEGTVRPKDISRENLINSSLIADARITYAGKGIISDRQSPGWLMNIVDKVWPF